MEAKDMEAELVGLFPPGVEHVLAIEGEPGILLSASGQVLYEHGAKQVDHLRLELCPLTAVEKLPDWEEATGLGHTPLSARGGLDQRRQQLLSRLRELGPPTLPLIRTVLAPLCAYASEKELVVLEVSKPTLRALHTYINKGRSVLSLLPLQIKLHVDDRGKVSQAGAQITLMLEAVELSALQAKLIPPSGPALVLRGGGRGVATGPVRLYAKACAGVAISGTWTLELSAPTGVLTEAALFVQSVNRGEHGHTGKGSAAFLWGFVAEEDKLGAKGPYDLRAVAAALARLNYARNQVTLVLRSKGPGKLPVGQLAAIPDDPNAIPDMCIPG